MKKKLLLITSGFPFGEYEQSFLSREAAQLTSDFDLVIGSTNTTDPQIHPFTGAHSIYRIFYPSFYQNISPKTVGYLLRPNRFCETMEATLHAPAGNRFQCMKSMFTYSYYLGNIKAHLREIIKKEKIDIVYSYWCSVSVPAALELKKEFPHLKVVTRLHRSDLYHHANKFNRQPYQSMVARGVDLLIFVCEEGKRYFVSHWGEEEKSRVCYLGCEKLPPVPHKEDGILRLVSCSNVIPHKRVDLIIKGLSLLPDTVPVEWNHFGDGTERTTLEHLAGEKLGNKPNIKWKFWGFVQNCKLGAAYQELCPDWFITTTASEGLPVSIQEAFSTGIPCIATEVNGNPELVEDNVTGYLLSANPDPEEVMQAISRAWESLPHWERFHHAAYEKWSENFDAKVNAEKFSALLQTL